MTVDLHAYDAITPAGPLLCGPCEAAGHPKTNPDLPLRAMCQIHNLEWYWCGGCGLIWCPGKLGQAQPHEGKVTPS